MKKFIYLSAFFLSTGTAWQINAAAVLNPGQPMSSANMSSPNCTLAATQQWVNGQPVGAIKCFQDLYKQYQYVVGISENDSISNSAISQQTAFFVDLIMQTANTMCTLNFNSDNITTEIKDYQKEYIQYYTCEIFLTALMELLNNHDQTENQWHQWLSHYNNMTNTSGTDISNMSRISQTAITTFYNQLKELKNNNFSYFSNYFNSFMAKLLAQANVACDAATTLSETCYLAISNLYQMINIFYSQYSNKSLAISYAKDLLALMNKFPEFQPTGLNELKNMVNEVKNMINGTYA